MESIGETINLSDINLIGKNSLDKHIKYENIYKKDELYWGIGIENEIYLEFDLNHIILETEAHVPSAFYKNTKKIFNDSIF